MHAGTKFAIASLALLAGTLAGASPAGAEVRDPSRFACPPGLESGFDDVAGTTHEETIACAVHFELTGGTGPRTFSPSADVTRGQMASFIARLLGVYEFADTFPSAGFADTAGSPHEAAINALVEIGIAQGTSATTFSPEVPVSRGQMARFLDRTAIEVGFPVMGAPPDAFSDDNGSDHEDAINRMALLGVTGGTGPGTYDPAGRVSRGAMTAFLVRMIDAGIERGLYAPPGLTSAVAVVVDAEGVVLGAVEVLTTEVPGVVCLVGDPALDGLDAVVRPTEGGDPVVTSELDSTGGGTPCTSDPAAAPVGEDPTAFSVAVVDGAEELGEGPVGTIDQTFIADMDDEQVVPGPGDRSPEVFGVALGFTTSVEGVLCVQGLFFSETASGAVAHLHEAPTHQNGPFVADVALSSLESDAPPGSGCSLSDRAADVGADPGAFYVDVHTDELPDGALRGQLEPVDPDAGAPVGAWEAFEA